jgi:ribosomal protein S27E
VQAQYADIQVLSAQTYQSTTFTGPDDQALSKPALALNTNSVVVHDPKSVYGTMNLVLLESVLDLTTLEVLPKSVTSVLLSAGGWVITTVIYRYLECGDLHFGFARVKCQDCGHEYLLAYSCNRRHFCPSCHQKRVVEFGQWLCTHKRYIRWSG